MPFCPHCPGRFFKDDAAVRMHRDSKHDSFECQHCNREFSTDEGRLAHEKAKHSAFECRYCDREFNSEHAREQHEGARHPNTFECHYCIRGFSSEQAREQHENARHPDTFECHYCDREFSSEQAREQHENAKHPDTFQCRHCDQEFSSEQAREQHENAKHPDTFECHHCDREFSSEQAREQHENAKHPDTFQCRYCDQEFNSEQAREQHEDAKHPTTFECQYCDQEFNSEDAREQHEATNHPNTFDCYLCDREFSSENALRQHQDTKHLAFRCHFCSRGFASESARQQHLDTDHCFQCGVCSKSFITVEALRQHERGTPHPQCSFCSAPFSTRHYKDVHERICSRNPDNPCIPSLSFFDPPPLPPSKDLKATVNGEEPDCAVSQRTVEPIEAPASPLLNSVSDEGETFHSTSELSIANTADVGVTAEQPRPCVHLFGSGPCGKCQETAPSIVEDEGTAVSAVDTCNHDSADVRYTIVQCTACMEIFETKEAFQDHACPVIATMVRPHCTICYTQFDSADLLQEHMDSATMFLCQLCGTWCCSDEVMQEHLLNHPTCNKCGKFFADDLALCAHVESVHPVVVCWDCDGIVVETGSLEMHYTDSPVHPSCVFCGVGKKDSADMDNHMETHVPNRERVDQSDGDTTDYQAGCGEEVPLTQDPSPFGEIREEDMPLPMEQDTHILPLTNLDMMDTSDDCKPGDGLYNSPLQTSSLSSSPLPAMIASPEVTHEHEHKHEHVDEDEDEDEHKMTVDPSATCEETSPDAVLRQYASPSPTPSEHGSDESRLQLLVAKATGTINGTEEPTSPVTSVFAEPFSDMSARSSRSPSPSSLSSQSIVFVTADGIPESVRENRAILVATSMSSQSSGRTGTPLRLASVSSSSASSLLASLDLPVPQGPSNRIVTHWHTRAPSQAQAQGQGNAPQTTHRLHCRICLRDPCEDVTATMCGHLFCKRCITQAIISKSECPVCKSATLLYCLFQLDLSV